MIYRRGMFRFRRRDNIFSYIFIYFIFFPPKQDKAQRRERRRIDVERRGGPWDLGRVCNGARLKTILTRRTEHRAVERKERVGYLFCGTRVVDNQNKT